MKRANQTAAAATSNGDEVRAGMQADSQHADNGRVGSENLSLILAGLQTMRDGDFSVRLPGTGRVCRERSPTPSTTS